MIVDLWNDKKVWETREIDKRVVSMIRQKYSLNDEQLLSRILHGASLGTYQMNEAEQLEVQDYQTHVEYCRTVGREAKAENELLAKILSYEDAVKKVNDLALRINGRVAVDEVPETPEVVDQDTGEVIQEYVPYQPAITAIDPMKSTIENVDEDGNVIIVDNPEYLATVEELNTAQAIIDNTTGDVLVWVNDRSSSS